MTARRIRVVAVVDRRQYVGPPPASASTIWIQVLKLCGLVAITVFAVLLVGGWIELFP